MSLSPKEAAEARAVVMSLRSQGAIRPALPPVKMKRRPGRTPVEIRAEKAKDARERRALEPKPMSWIPATIAMDSAQLVTNE